MLNHIAAHAHPLHDDNCYWYDHNTMTELDQGYELLKVDTTATTIGD